MMREHVKRFEALLETLFILSFFSIVIRKILLRAQSPVNYLRRNGRRKNRYALLHARNRETGKTPSRAYDNAAPPIAISGHRVARRGVGARVRRAAGLRPPSSLGRRDRANPARPHGSHAAAVVGTRGTSFSPAVSPTIPSLSPEKNEELPSDPESERPATFFPREHDGLIGRPRNHRVTGKPT